jgi:two-component system response regulator FixJ
MADTLRIALIDDDEHVLEALRLLLLSKDMAPAAFASAKDFLAALDRAESFDCLVTDVRMPRMSGIELVEELNTRSVKIPAIIITGKGDIDMAVGAMKLGAVDFMEKPYNEARLLASIDKAVNRKDPRDDTPEVLALREKYDALTPRQRQVMQLAAQGLSSKEIARLLEISDRTVENHRAWLMDKMGARNLAELVRMAILLG